MTGYNTPIISLKDVYYSEKEDIYEYVSFTNKEKTYLVFCQDRERRKIWECTCYDFMYRHRECKHITRIKFIDECRVKVDLLCPQNKGLLHENDNI